MTKMTRRQYAEKVLDAHGVWADAEARWQEHATLTDSRAALVGTIRDLKSRIETRELEIIDELTADGAFAELSATASKEFVKQATRSDAEHRELTERLAVEEGDREAVDLRLHHAELGCRLLAARMHELGGLLFFYGPPEESQESEGD